MKNKITCFALFFLAITAAGFISQAPADEEFQCEVLNLTGHATATDAEGKVRVLQEGDLVAKGETVATAADSVMDLSFDSEWKNVTRLEEKSKLKVTSVYPGKLKLSEGAVFARLKALPKGSTFEVKTPTAVATVRGTEYRTSFIDGRTEVFNVSPSKVFVYGMKVDGSVDSTQELVLEQSKKTQVADAGKAPEPALDLTPEESKVTEVFKSQIATKIQEVQAAGRKSAIQSVAQMEAFENKAAANKLEPNPTEESRVVDLRRRPFKKSE